MDIGDSFDRYVMQARVVPVLLVVFPLASLVVIWLPEESVGWRLLGGLVSLVLLSLVAQVGRDGGKRHQEALFRKWNGKPSIRKLRHRDSNLPWITMERLRSSLASAVGIPSPTKAEEVADPAMADEVYAAYVDHLREATRADKILLSENIGYGFRRNLWAMKLAGTAFAIIGLMGASIGAALSFGTSQMIVPASVVFINSALIVFWIIRVNDGWVRDSAEAYADRLIHAYLGQKYKEPCAAA